MYMQKDMTFTPREKEILYKAKNIILNNETSVITMYGSFLLVFLYFQQDQFVYLVLYTITISLFFTQKKEKIELFLYKKTKKRLSIKEKIQCRYKNLVINRPYLRIKRFWKHDYLKGCKNLNTITKTWHSIIIVIISIYNGLSTRYIPLSTFYFANCTWCFFAQNNPIGLVYMLVYLVPLAYLTFWAAFPPIAYSLNKAYGIHTLKKLGFDNGGFIWVHFKTCLIALFIGAITRIGYVFLNDALSIPTNRQEVNIVLKEYDKKMLEWKSIRELGLEKTMPEYPNVYEIYDRRIFPDITVKNKN